MATRAARHVFGVVAQDEGDALGDFVGPAEAAPRQVRAADLHLLLGEKFSLARRVNPAGMHDVDADAMADQLDGRRAGHVVDGRLRHVVGHGGGDGEHRVRRADDDDRAASALLHHLFGRGPQAVKARPTC